MHPILFELGGFTRLHLRRAAGGRVSARAAVRAGARAARAASTRNRVMDLGIWIIISALVGAKLLLLVVDFGQFTTEPRELCQPGRDPAACSTAG